MNSKFTLYNDDCLNVIDRFPLVKAVIADPPYMINMKSDMHGKVNPWADNMNGSAWYAAWMKKCRDHLRSDGCLWVFSNWRGLPTLIKAGYDIGWPVESLMVWDKGGLGLGTHRGLRPTYELVALFAMPHFFIENRGLADVQRFPWSSKRPHGHPAEKPQKLLEFLIENSTVSGDIVADPFMGSGTTGAAALETGRQFVGVEMDAGWYKKAKSRISESCV